MKNMQARLGAMALSCLLMIGVMPVATVTTGCTSTQIVDLLNTLGTASASVATLEGDTATAAAIKTDTAAAVAAVENWQKGSPATEAIEALNVVAADLSLIPGTSQYAALITLAIGTVDSLLALLPAPAAAPSALTAHAAAPRRTVSLQNAPKTKAQFKAQWNAIVNANPTLASAKL